MKCFRPPFIFWHPKSAYINCRIHKVTNLLLQCQPTHKVFHSCIHTQFLVAEPVIRQCWILGNIACQNCKCLARNSTTTQQNCGKQHKEIEENRDIRCSVLNRGHCDLENLKKQKRSKRLCLY